MKYALSAIKGGGYKVLFSNEAYIELDKLIESESYSKIFILVDSNTCLLYTSPSPRDVEESRMPSSA